MKDVDANVRTVGRRRDGALPVVVSSLLTGVFAAVVGAQPAGNVEERRLDFVEARITWEETGKTLQRARELQQDGLISEAELDAEDARVRLAEVQMRRAYLNLVLADPEVVLREARKYQGRDGEVRVELDVVARWSFGLDAGDADLSGATTGLPKVEGIANVVVSLKTTRSHREGVLVEPTIVSVPYEQRIPVMRFDEPMIVGFGLLAPEVQELLVEFRYNNAVHDRQVLLGKRAYEDGPLVLRSDQITLDAELGGDAVFGLSLERFDDARAIYDLRMEGLPAEVAFQITDPDSGAAFSQVFFPDGMTDRELQLKLSMPDRPTADVVPGRVVPFRVALQRDTEGAPDDRSAVAGGLDLVVIPRGVAELKIEAANLYHEVARDGSVEFELRVVNAGSLALEQVEITVDMPFGWREELQPSLFPSLEPGREETALVVLTPPGDAIVGDYQGSVRAGSLAGDRSLQSETRTLRLHVVAPGNPWLVALLSVLVLVVAAGAIWAGVRLSRR